MVHKVKKQNNFTFYFTSYINLSGVFHTHSRVSNNLTVTSICLVLKSSLYDTYPRPCDCQFYLLILPTCLFHSIICFKIKKKQYSNSLLISNIENI